MTQKAFIGNEAIKDWLQYMQSIAPRHCLLVRGKKSFDLCGGKKVIDELVNITNCKVTEYSDFSVNPKYEEAISGVELFIASKADIIVAVGGGSVLDMAKLIRHMAAEKGYAAPLHAFPTTAGTGAEATHFAVVYIDGKKQSIAADDVLPDVAVVYPQFTYQNDAYLTACTGFDALAQAIESYWAKGATEESRRYSVRALELLWHQLPQLVQAPNEGLRDQVAEGAYWAGRAINISTTTAPHAFSYAFTSHYNYPHGHAVALTFPFFMKLNGTQDLYELLDVRADEAMQKMEEYILELGLSMQLAPEVDIKGMLQEVNIQRLSNNPIKVTLEIIADLEIYLKSHQKEDFSRYNGEGTPLRKAQLRMVEILKEVDGIFRRNNIDYWIDAGTLLGAVRHGGFIPWDDDVDISLRREDYDRAREALQKELPKSMVFVDWTTDKNYFDACGRVKSRNSHVDLPIYRFQKEQGIWVDIFPMETLATYKEKLWGEKIFGKVFRHAHNEGLAVKKSRLAYWLTRFLALLLYPMGYMIISFFRYRGRKHANVITYGFALCTVYPKHQPEWIFPTQDIEFENLVVRAPHDYKSYLTEFYGNYMQIPPKEKRVVHSNNWKIW